MADAQIVGLDEANKLVVAHTSPRYKELDLLDRFVEGTQYKGRPNWWTANDTPLAEREPCIVYPIPAIAIASFVDLVLGEHRFPDLSVEGLEAEDLRRLQRRSRFATVMRESLAAGLGCGSACIIAGIRNERPFLDTAPAKWCVPTFKPGTSTVIKLDISYPFIVEEKDVHQSGRWIAKAKLFRRCIDETSDTTYLPIELRAGEMGEPTWVVDRTRTVDHELGYCPSVWWACNRGACIEGRYDGHAIHEKILDEITAHDLSLSQRQRAAFMAGDPQWTETGVEPGYNPSPGGRTMSVPATPDGGTLAQGQRVKAAYVASSGSPARKKGPGNVWQYEDPHTKVDLHQLAAGALDAIDKNSHDIRLKLCDAMSFVPLDPESLPRMMISGKALEALKERQLARCDTIRDDVGDNLLIPTLAMLCRATGLGVGVEIEAKPKRKSKKIVIDMKPAQDAPLMKPLVVDDDSVTITWPPYYTPNAEDRGKELSAEVEATTAISSYIKNPAYDKIAKKRIARLVLDGASDEDLETIDTAIDTAPVEQAQPAPQQSPNGLPPGMTPPPAPPPATSTPQKMPPPSGAKDSTGGTPNASAAPQTATPSRAVAPNEPKAAAAATPTVKTDDVAGPAEPIKGTGGVKQAPSNIHQRAASAAGVAETVYQLLKDDYDYDAIDWVRAAHWEGPIMVSLDQIDFQNAEQWSATKDTDKVDDFQQKIADGHMKPIVLVNEPNDNKLRIIDGHHRALAYDKLQQPVMAYVAHVGAISGPWDSMHSSQKNLGGLERSMQKPKG